MDLDTQKRPGNLTVAVWMVTYNHQNFIVQAVESVMKQQTNFQFTLFIGEDCSKDNTLQLCKELQSRYPSRIVLMPAEKNMGPTPNALRIYKACFTSGAKYIAMIEGDDYWTDPYKLQKQVDFLEANPDFVACFHPVKVVDSEGRLLQKSKNSFVHNRDVSADELMKGRVMSTLSICYRNVLQEFPEEFHKSPTGDNFLCSLLGNFGKGKYLDTVEPAAYRMHAGGAWSLKDDTQKKMTLLSSYFWMWQYYARTGKPEYARAFYRKVILEGFYSDPFKELDPSILGKAELFIVRSVRKMFRIARRLFLKPVQK